MNTNSPEPEAARFHRFPVEAACRCGVPAAVLLYYMQHWVSRNQALGQNSREGRTWTYVSIAQLGRVFPYLSAKQIRTALGRLEQSGLLVSGSFNRTACDRTKWYSLTEQGLAICPTGQMELPPGANASAPQGKPIPVKAPVGVSVGRKEGSTHRPSPSRSYDAVIARVFTQPETVALVWEWLKLRKARHNLPTDYSLALNLNKLQDCARRSGMTVNDYLREVISRGWMSFYPIGTQTKPAPTNTKENRYGTELDRENPYLI